MKIYSNRLLKDYTTMRLGGPAKAFIIAHSKQEVVAALQWAEVHNYPVWVLGGGSNVIVGDKGFEGLVLVPDIREFTPIEDTPFTTTFRIGAGEVWDEVVEKTVAMNLSGVEFLSAIPGTAGATPVQNVGAYGAEIADVFIELEAYDMKTGDFVILAKDECQFGYRTSRFKSLDDRRYIILSITIRLEKAAPTPPFYASLERYLKEHSLSPVTSAIIREAVIALRAKTLPDPSRIANTGSFFKNPIISRSQSESLLSNYPDMPFYEVSKDMVKVPAGWLIDHAGLKGYAAHGMRTYSTNALVLINEKAKGYADLAAFREEIVAKVQKIFGITLEQEPELIL